MGVTGRRRRLDAKGAEDDLALEAPNLHPRPMGLNLKALIRW